MGGGSRIIFFDVFGGALLKKIGVSLPFTSDGVHFVLFLEEEEEERKRKKK